MRHFPSSLLAGCLLLASCSKIPNSPELDSRNPELKIVSPTTEGAAVVYTPIIVVEGNAADDAGIAKVSYSLSGNTGAYGDALGNGDWAKWTTPQIHLNKGKTTISITAEDVNGNETTADIEVEYKDPLEVFTFTASRLVYSDVVWEEIPDTTTGTITHDTVYTGHLIVQNQGDTTINGIPVKKIESTQIYDDPYKDFTYTRVFVDYVAFTDSGWTIVAFKAGGSSLAFLKTTQAQSDSIVVYGQDSCYKTIAFPLTGRSSWKTYEQGFSYTVKMVKSQEQVTTPAGTYNCVHVYSDLLVTYRYDDLYADQWYAPGVGLVKQKISFGKTRYDPTLNRKYEEMQLISVE